jgi:hypothetical protein
MSKLLIDQVFNQVLIKMGDVNEVFKFKYGDGMIINDDGSLK